MKKIVIPMVTSMFALWLSGCSHYHNGEVSDHYDGKRFFNPGKPMTKGLGAFLKWRFSGERGVWPEFAPLETNDSPPQRVEGSELRVSFVGHATILIQTEGLNILTDPTWSNRASLVQWAGPERVHPPGVAMEDLPPIDVVLISHNHYDHLDLATLKELSRNDQLRVIVPLGNKKIVQGAGSDINVGEFDWGESVQVSRDVKITLEPMHHWSARGLLDRNKALWASFVIETPNGNIYFVGDSGYGGGDYTPPVKKLAINTFLLIGEYDDVTPIDPVVSLAEATFSKLEVQIVKDDHLLHKSFTELDWKELLP